MTIRPTPSWSIRRRVLAWLFLAMAFVFSANLLSSYYSNIEAANSAFDRLLLASASAIAERTVAREGGIHVDIPYVALDMLASTAQDRVFYTVLAPDGEIVTGYEDLPLPKTISNVPVFYDSIYKQVSVRIVVLRRFVSGNNLSGYTTIQVAQTRGDRDGLSYNLLRQSALWMLVIAIVGAITAWFGVSVGLRPLARLRDALGRRSPDDVRPVLHDVPNEFRPLVGAINSMLHRLDNGLQSMRNFISDASHQLKTPLASLLAQSEMALRESDPDDLREALIKVNKSAQRTSRLAQQLLAHASAAGASPAFAELNLARLVRETIEILLPQAIAKNIDLGYEGGQQAIMQGDRILLGEMVLNLVDNAIKYSPDGSMVTLGIKLVDGALHLIIDDDGPGIQQQDRQNVFERFVRLQSSSAEGCGLGLAIVNEIAIHHGAEVSLGDAPDGGLRVDVVFPANTREDS
ncbi:MAG: sensor histidine kinase [Rhodospirillales bacterium]|jgi:two-component system, OmpR family, sensor histidine kinase TctE|nr:sensor histidine kinase [Rhodospirillales bacterium]